MNKTPFSRLFPLAACTAASLLAAACTTTASYRQPRSGQGQANAPVPAGHYRVQRGDTLYRIGMRFNQPAATLAAWNNLSDPTQIEVGQVLRVRPAGGESAAPARTGGGTPSLPNAAMRWPADGEVIGRYNGGSNKGIDIGGNRGDAVRAAAAGKVMYVGSKVRGYGNLILISHGRSTLTAYAHNEQLLVSKGQTVQAGQQIATMGSSDADRVKLHFEVRVNGKAANPEPYLGSR
ncbi:MAG: peptidoglycan DD-metalloendopeptidase family protein [Neisseria sp.]|nr:peptidoglycan DD-metalloendopeptidase family protein [Neisseria sp.]